MAPDFQGLEPTANDGAGLAGRVRILFEPLCIAHSSAMAGTKDVVMPLSAEPRYGELIV